MTSINTHIKRFSDYISELKEQFALEGNCLVPRLYLEDKLRYLYLKCNSKLSKKILNNHIANIISLYDEGGYVPNISLNNLLKELKDNIPLLYK